MRIFLVCADKRLKTAMLLLLDNQPGMVVSGISDRLQGLIDQLEHAQPDVLLMEWENPLGEMKDLFTDIHNLDYPPKILYLSNRQEEREFTLNAGADYFFLTNAPPDDLLKTLNELRLSLKESQSNQLREEVETEIQ